MRMNLLAAAILSAVLAGCGDRDATSAPTDDVAAGAATDAATDAATPTQSEADRAFAALSGRFVDEGLALSPVYATGQGEHRHDAELDDLSAEGRAKSLAWAKAMLADVQQIDAAALSRENQVDLAILRNQLEYSIWDEEVFQRWAWDPQSYSALAGGAIYSLMAREFAPMPERLAASSRMRASPCSWSALGTMKVSISDSTPAFCRATVSAWVFGTRAGSRFARACASSAGSFSMRAVAAASRSGIGANSRAIRL